jgi:hypothetical protein
MLRSYCGTFGTTGAVAIGGAACASKGNVLSDQVIITHSIGGVTCPNNTVTGSVTITDNPGAYAGDKAGAP